MYRLCSLHEIRVADASLDPSNIQISNDFGNNRFTWGVVRDDQSVFPDDDDQNPLKAIPRGPGWEYLTSQEQELLVTLQSMVAPSFQPPRSATTSLFPRQEPQGNKTDGGEQPCFPFSTEQRNATQRLVVDSHNFFDTGEPDKRWEQTHPSLFFDGGVQP